MEYFRKIKEGKYHIAYFIVIVSNERYEIFLSGAKSQLK
jgi:hypothetical protein